MHKLVLASAGAGKSERIVRQALEIAAANKKVLLLTYTINNQAQLVKQICRVNTLQPKNIVVKGWFSFLLEDMIRPYQRCILSERVSGIVLDSSNPHLKDKFHLPGRKEEEVKGVYNPLHFVTKASNAAHTTFLSKLATRINKKTDGQPAQRLASIYSAVFIDEVQDLVGWDFDVIKAIAKTNVEVFDCVGDFRQTIYRTSVAPKKPQSNKDKLAAFEKMGFTPEHLNISWRCSQTICDLAHLIHASDGHYMPTLSKVNNIPVEFADHHGVFAVTASHVDQYIQMYNPVILRWNRQAKKKICEGRVAYNFGEAKGIGFDRVLILPTEKHGQFLSGNKSVFGHEDTDGSRNKLYVGITRARYSVAFLHAGATTIDGAQVWKPVE